LVPGPFLIHSPDRSNQNLTLDRDDVPMSVRERASVRKRNVEGNERLTAWVGATLFVLLAIEGLTIASVQSLLVPHVVVGMLILAAVGLKIASTGYRFVRYYQGDPTYREKGPPAPLLRILGPVVILTSIAVLFTGVVLLYVPTARVGQWLQYHQATFVLWFLAMSVHVLNYLWRIPGQLLAEFGARRPFGRRGRLLVLSFTLMVGLATSLVVLGPARIWLAHFISGTGH